MDGFASDSVRMIGTLRKDAQQHVQILLFSATFNEKVKNYALRVVRDNGREEANQVRSLLHVRVCLRAFLLQCCRNPMTLSQICSVLLLRAWI